MSGQPIGEGAEGDCTSSRGLMQYLCTTSHAAPDEILTALAARSYALSRAGAVLRATPEDAFEQQIMAQIPSRSRELVLPWAGYTGQPGEGVTPAPEAIQAAAALAAQYNWMWWRYPPVQRTRATVKVLQILGADLATPVQFILGYFPSARTNGLTEMVEKLAEEHEIPIENLWGRTDLPPDAVCWVRSSREAWSRGATPVEPALPPDFELAAVAGEEAVMALLRASWVRRDDLARAMNALGGRAAAGERLGLVHASPEIGRALQSTVVAIARRRMEKRTNR